jgi:hypothetical protein
MRVFRACLLLLVLALSLYAFLKFGQNGEDNVSATTSTLTHVIVPFVPKQKKKLLQSLALWSDFPPCSGRAHPFLSLRRPRLVFFVAFVKEGKEDRINAAFREEVVAGIPEAAAKCFEKVEWLEVGLTAEENVYPKGPNLMFEAMLRQANQSSYQYVMFMEPDVRPIQSNWLTQLVLLCSWPQAHFWVKGILILRFFRCFSKETKTRVNV